MIRMSSTTIEQFRRWKHTEYDDFEKELEAEARLLATIDKQPFEPTIQMMRGTAFDKIIENPPMYYDGGKYTFLFANGLLVEFLEADINFAVKKQLPGIWQQKYTKLYDIDGLMIEVVGVADMLYGNLVIDNKTTWSGFDYDNYAASAQWRFYLEIFEADQFRYNVFEFRADRNDVIQLRDYHCFHFQKYAGLERDNLSLVAEFVRYLEIKGRIGQLLMAQ